MSHYYLMREKGFALLLLLVGVLIMVLIGGGAYYLSITKNSKVESTQNVKTQNIPEPIQSLSSAQKENPGLDKTTNWKTYQHKELGIQFKYPADWVINEEDQNSVTIRYPNYFGTIIVSKNISTNYKNISNCKEGIQFPCKENLKSTKLDGLDAVSFTKVDGPGGYWLVVQTINEPKIQLSMDARGGGLSAIFDSLLSSFKFTQ